MKPIIRLLAKLTDLWCSLTLHSFYSPLRFHGDSRRPVTDNPA